MIRIEAPDFAVRFFQRHRSVCRALLASALPALGLSLLYMLPWPEGPRFSLTRIVHPESLLPVPFAFFMWFWLMDCEQEFHLKPRWLTGAASLLLMAIAADPADHVHGPGQAAALALGTLLGLFCFAAPGECLRRAPAQPRLLLVTLALALSSVGFYATVLYLWYPMSRSTALIVYYLLDAAGMEISVHAFERMGKTMLKPALELSTAEFSVTILPMCSGLEGIFIFCFLLSATLLLDWKLLSRMRLLELYLAGFLLMFLMNVLRIALIFLIGVWGKQPDAPSWAKRIGLQMFHSHAGWIFYLLAFGLFVTALYRFAGRLAAGAADDAPGGGHQHRN